MSQGPAPSSASPPADNFRKNQVVIIDPGHTAKSPGALGIRGVHEVKYNDTFAAIVSRKLSAAGFRTVLTRGSGEEVALDARADKANLPDVLAFLSIHHDSAQPKYLEQIAQNGKKGFRTRTPISGFSIFVSGKSFQFGNSLILAGMIGEELLHLGRKPTLHHAEPIEGENRPLLDERLGIYQYDDLVVLKKTAVPAVLLEVGLIVNEEDEKYVSSTRNQEAMADAIVRALKAFALRGNNK